MTNEKFIKLEIEGLSQDDIKSIFGSAEPEFGLKVKLTDNIEFENRTSIGFGFEPFSMLTIFLSATASIASSIVANAIYDSLKGRVNKIDINNKKVEVDIESIKKALDEIKKQEDNK